jgi:hypothetical protein
MEPTAVFPNPAYGLELRSVRLWHKRAELVVESRAVEGLVNVQEHPVRLTLTICAVPSGRRPVLLANICAL